MAFKIKSTVSVYEYPPIGQGEGGVVHVVLSRERLLHPGEKIPVSGSLTFDVETKGDWLNAEGEIRIIDGETLGIRWRVGFLDALVYSLSPEVGAFGEIRRWGPEKIIKGDKTLELGDIYHHEPVLPEVFSLAERARLGSLTEKMLQRVEGMKKVDRKTELIYEP